MPKGNDTSVSKDISKALEYLNQRPELNLTLLQSVRIAARLRRGELADRLETPRGFSILTVVKEFIEDRVKSGCSVAYVEDVTRTYTRFVEHLQTYLDRVSMSYVQLNHATPERVDAFLQNRMKSPNTRIQNWVLLNMLFKFAIQRNYMAYNPMEEVTKPRAKPVAAEILLHDEARILFETVCDGWDRLVPVLALRMFAGVRKAEALRLLWGDGIDLHRRMVVLHPGVTKTSRGRAIPMEDNLFHILSEYEGREIYWEQDLFERARKASGVKVPRNALRKSFVSYHARLHNDLHKTALCAGHSIQVSLHYYQALALPDEAEAYFKIGKDIEL